MNYHRKSRRFVRSGAILLVLFLALVGIAGSGLLFAMGQPGLATVDEADDELLAIYILAFDNNRDSVNSVNLTTKYTETVASIVAATAGRAGVTAVILADLDAYGDTHILVATDGVAEPVAGLPNRDGDLDTAITEYNTADGLTLGGFLVWARRDREDVKTYLSYIAHGTPLAPAARPSIAEIVLAPGGSVRASSAIVMPMSIGANPDFTDNHDADANNPFPQLLTPYDLGVALKMGTENSGPLEVLDLVHCFAASIEELYEVAPYAQTTVAAPNYAFFDPAMAGEALTRVADTLSDFDPRFDPAKAMATTIQNTYISTIPADGGHPYVLTVVDNSKLLLVKQRWDDLSAILLNRLALQPEETANKILAAYLATATNTDGGGVGVYDTTFCGQRPEYKLEAPDALADITSFSWELRTRYGSGSDVEVAANAVIDAVDEASWSLKKQNGSPWWVPNPANWTFKTNLSGIALFTPLVPMEVDGVSFHAWQSLWYTKTTVIAEGVELDGRTMDIENTPYQFILRDDEGVTWADVLNAYWNYRGQHPMTQGVALCLPEIQEVEETDVSITAVSSANPVKAGATLVYTLTVTNKTTLTTADVVLTNTLPDDVTFTAVSDPQVCQHDAGVVTCAWSQLGSHETRTVVIAGRVDMFKVGPMLNQAEVIAAGEQRTQDNRWVTETDVLQVWWNFIPAINVMP